ncbi:GNAT family N-acetyltransferase [uncultured Eudoraea sp.]|uniref:GNAT family N-acetyltransferase n=1 Tax=uncultured Eudoraea sp. TaxID=1035614 RepID=UPI002609273C|nr:GNAT family N-acetyltransferase [uncultured Eudoraea sp.]
MFTITITSINSSINIVSVRENPAYKGKAIEYLQKSWPSVQPIIYEDCISHSIDARNSLPQWYLLELNGFLIGCAGLITNDFISRGDLYPWLCALFIEEQYRGNDYGSLLIDRAKRDTKNFGFEYLYLCTSHIGYYEKYDFTYIGQGYHPWGEESRIYETLLNGD